jgi:amidase
LTDWLVNHCKPGLKPHTVRSLWDATIAREIYRAAYAEAWRSTGTITASGDLEGAVDVILCPVGPSVAPKLETARYWGYTSIWNLLDYPAAVFPVSKISESDDVKVTHTPRDERDAYNWGHWESEGAKGYADAPIGLQLVARRHQDEKLLRALEDIVQETGLPFL